MDTEHRRETAEAAQHALEQHLEDTRIGEEPEDRKQALRLREAAQREQDYLLGNDW